MVATMAEPPLDRDEFVRWRAEASSAMRSASVQAQAELYNWSCFASEQAAQLAVKGLLHGLGLGPWGHDLVGLGEQLGQVTEVSGELMDALRRLSRHYIPSRHPDAHPSGPPGTHYGTSDSAQALADAGVVLRAVDSTWEALSA